MPERVKTLDGRSYPSRRPQVIARDDREQDRAQAALAVVPDINSRRTLDVNRAERVARESESARRRAEQVAPTSVHGSVDIRHGDFREVLGDLEAASVDAIVTDPPYEREFWPLYEDLALLATRLLKPSGVLAVMIGTRLEMLEFVDERLSAWMERRWRGVYLTPGQRWRDQVEHVATGWKPILFYRVPGMVAFDRWINDDVFASSGTNEADQRFHRWGQSEGGIASLIERLTEPGQLVVDPFLGGGTGAVVCEALGRRFVGCDTDAAAVSTTRERLA